jgi:predicted nucleotidyltransferase
MLACFTLPAYHLTMLDNNLWQDATIRDLVALLRPDEDVWAAALSGSCAHSQAEKDVWSDVDVLVVIKEQAISRFFPGIAWLQPLGEVYAYEQHSNELAYTTRVCFKDFRRLDVVLTTEFALEQIDSWGMVSFWKGTRTLFSRSPTVDKVLAREFEQPPPPLISPERFQAMTNLFWYKAALAVTKVARNDLLIALHLALDLVRDCCVLGMLLRDRVEGTSYHRQGGLGNEVVAQLRPTQRPFDAAGLLGIVEQSSIAFDKLAVQWSSEYKENRQPLLAFINLARRDALGE